MHVNSDSVVALLSPETVNEIALHHQLEEKCQTNAFSVLPLESIDPSAELGPMDSGGCLSAPGTLRS